MKQFVNNCGKVDCEERVRKREMIVRMNAGEEKRVDAGEENFSQLRSERGNTFIFTHRSIVGTLRSHIT